MNRRQLFKALVLGTSSVAVNTVAPPAAEPSPHEALLRRGVMTCDEARVRLEIDGRALAEAVAPHLPGAVRRLGLG
jgi:hypothetical protein